MGKIIFHSNHCPRCSVLEKKLKENKIDYDENNDIQLMIEKGIETTPALEVDGAIMDFKESVQWIGKSGE